MDKAGAYDTLNRLIQAMTTGPEYGLNWSYDGFGNLTSQQLFKGTGYNTNLSYNGLTNRIVTPGYTYDANGNLTAMPSLTMQYDVQNRMISSTHATGGSKRYAYAPNGQRVAESDPPSSDYTRNTWWIYFYGPDGRLVAGCGAAYVAPDPQYPQTVVFTATCGTAYVYFGGKLVRKESKPQLQNGLWVYPRGVTPASDRLGSMRYQQGASTFYYPYGEKRTPTTNDTQKFATYTRDSATSLDYANARYYSSQVARFTTPDPYVASGGPADPQRWNRYAYVGNDPVNFKDGRGLFRSAADDDEGPPQTSCYTNGTWWSDSFCDYAYGQRPYLPLVTVTPWSRAVGNLYGAINALLDRNNVSADCQKDLDALSQAAGYTIDLGIIQAVLATTDFQNGMTSTLPVSSLYGPGAEAAGAAYQRQEDAKYGPGQVIGNEFARNPQGLTAATVLLGSTIFINPALIGNVLANNEGLLFHEALHELGPGDTTIQTVLGLTVDDRNTKNITTKLPKDCITRKGNN